MKEFGSRVMFGREFSENSDVHVQIVNQLATFPRGVPVQTAKDMLAGLGPPPRVGGLFSGLRLASYQLELTAVRRIR